MYVGITRAEEKLFLTFAKRRLIYGDYKYLMPSRFLDEIPHSLLSTNTKGTEETVTVKVGCAPRTNIDKYSEPVKNMSFGKNFKAPVQTPKVSVPKFEIGTRVFHEKFGEGEIERVFDVGNTPMYAVAFDKVGKRLIDAKLPLLKKC